VHNAALAEERVSCFLDEEVEKLMGDGVWGAEDERKSGSANAARAQLGSECAQDASLQGAEIRHQPIAHA
jgi:hypothetical protein